MSEARSWGDSPLCAADGRQTMEVVFALGEGGDYQLQGEWTSAGSLVTRETRRGACPSQPL